MIPTMPARRVLALVCAVCLIAATGTALAGDEKSDLEKPGYLGVHLQDIDSGLAKALQLGDKTGVLVSEVVDDSPAATAGLEDGDVILEFDGAAIEGAGDLSQAVRKTSPGQEVELVVVREGEQQTVKIEIGERENSFVWTTKGGDFEFDEDFQFEHFGDDDGARVIIKRMHGDGDRMNVFISGLGEDRGYMGIHLDDLNEQLGEYFGVEDGEGALVTEVVADSPAAAAGLVAGDVIVKLGDEDIASAADIHTAMAGTEADQEIKLEIKRQGKGKSLDVKLGEMPEDVFKKHLQIIGEDDEYHIVAPKMLYRGPHEMRHMRVRGPQHLEVIREFEGATEDLDEMREELEKMRAELDEMRQELKKN